MKLNDVEEYQLWWWTSNEELEFNDTAAWNKSGALPVVHIVNAVTLMVAIGMYYALWKNILLKAQNVKFITI